MRNKMQNAGIDKLESKKFSHLKFQITNSKSQISSKLQYSNKSNYLFRISELVHWNLFDVWCLLSGAYKSLQKLVENIRN
jgi:hypothetical protein